MHTIAISKFKAKCLAIVDKVNRTQQPVVITRRGKPIAELVPIRREWLASMKDTFEIVGDITAPVFDAPSFRTLK